MKLKSIILFFLIFAQVAFAQSDAKDTTNTRGERIDTDIEANAFLSALARGTSITFDELAALNNIGGNIQGALDGKLSLSGGTMTGSLDMGAFNISNATTITAIEQVISPSGQFTSISNLAGTGAPQFPHGLGSTGNIDAGNAILRIGLIADGSSNNPSININSRQLIASDGSTAMIDWADSTLGRIGFNNKTLTYIGNVYAGNYYGGSVDVPTYATLPSGADFNNNSLTGAGSLYVDYIYGNNSSAAEFPNGFISGMSGGVIFKNAAGTNGLVWDHTAYGDSGLLTVPYFWTNVISTSAGDLNIGASSNVIISPSGNIDLDSGTLFVDTTNNYVGVGTPAPTAPFQVSNPSALQMSLKNTIAATYRMEFGQRTDGSGYFYNYSDNFGSMASLDITGHPLIFKNDSGEVGRFNTTGDFEITNKIELGHATDTTISRSAAGVVDIEGDPIMTRAADETVSGDKAMTGAVTIVDQPISTETSALNMGSATKLLHFSTNAITYVAPFTITTPTTGVSSETNQATYNQIGTDLNSVGKVGIVSYALGSSGSGDTWNCSVPFTMSGRTVVTVGNEYVVVRIQTGLSGAETIPLKGSDPIPANERGIGIEFRLKPSSTELQCRLYARDGYPTVSGTFLASSWLDLNSNAYAYTFSYVLEHIPTTNTVNLYLKHDAANSTSRGAKISTTPALTISGAGVPDDYQYVGTNKASVLGLVVPDGTNSPANATALTVFPHLFEIKQ